MHKVGLGLHRWRLVPLIGLKYWGGLKVVRRCVLVVFGFVGGRVDTMAVN